MGCIRANLFKSSYTPFIEMLKENEIKYGEVKTFSTAPMASGMVLALYGFLQTAAPWAALAAVLVAWIKSKSSRKVIITTKDNQVIHLEGLSPKETERLLEVAINLAVIDTDSEPKP
ncbi:hypothetical protein [Pseudomonas sp. BN102]|uniref:hypothetical protein n=1 Tax=Pseudomonas sp. BN102 TaxID=2567886 RepID=UPI002456AE0F|nr:hypothetical protein [Pseudomonas sp. BN102]MDH4610470.1 hypothetical protein [Pseudomonas sp. BN102]